MPSKYEQYEALASSYEKHPDQGLKACKKKLQRDPSNIIYLVSVTPALYNKNYHTHTSLARPSAFLAEALPR
jgi:hypothetical protein